jgi:FkbM family methyltransferase
MGLRLWLAKLIEFHIFHPPQHIGHKILRKIAWWIHRTRWEPNNDCQVFVSHLREGMTVMDVGANLGLYSLLISRAVGPSGKVYAFEPVPEIFARLKEHIALNNATNVIPVPIALSDEKGKAKMSVRGGESSLFRRVSDEFVEVPTERLNDFVEREGIGRVDAIKLDVEGAELHVIRGADKTIRRFKPIMMVEINPDTLKAAGTTPQELFDAIVSYGYKAHVIRKGKAVPVTQPVKPKRRGIGIFFDDYLFLPIR